MSAEQDRVGRVTGVFGPVVRAEVDFPVALSEVARVGTEMLLGEVIALDGREAVAQVYEDTAGLAPGDPFRTEGAPLSVELGPGLLGQVFDGIQRPLEWLAREEGDFLGRGRQRPRPRSRSTLGIRAVGRGRPGRRRRRRARHVPGDAGDRAPGARAAGDPGKARRDRARGAAARRGRHRADRTRAASSPSASSTAGGARGAAGRRAPPFSEPLVTGQRVLDTFFPLPRGGAAGMPGGFGTGKTVMQQQLCQVGAGRRHRVRRLRRARQRDDAHAARAARAGGSAHRAPAGRSHGAGREHLEHAGRRARGLALHRRHHGRVLPRHGLPRGAARRLDLALGGGAARDLRPPRRDAGRGGLPPVLSSRLAAFYERAGPRHDAREDPRDRSRSSPRSRLRAAT